MVFQQYQEFLLRAIELAKKARGQTTPNPMVGAIIINSQNQIIGEGFHEKAGEAHAEIHALKAAYEIQKDLSDCTLIITLEACNHFGKTPPCVSAILESKIKTVVVGIQDPNPLMQGKSVQLLRENGVTVHVESDLDCQKLIRGFKTVLENKRPFITLKAATSLDGKIATAMGESQWITNEDSRRTAHQERMEHDAILVGVGTVLKDNPRLDIRVPGALHSLKKIILDSRLSTPLEARVFETPGPVIIYCDEIYPQEKKKQLEEKGALIVPTKFIKPGELDLHLVVENLAQEHRVQDLLVEGGAKVLGAFVRYRLFDRFVYFISPKILGSEGLDVFEGYKASHLKDCVQLQNIKTRLIGHDVLIEGENPCSPA